MTQILAQASPVAPHRAARRAVKVMVGVVLFTAAAAGLYEGAQAVARHYQAPTGAVSYADADTIYRTLAGAWHTPATAGDFRPSSDISGGHVVSVVVVVDHG